MNTRSQAAAAAAPGAVMLHPGVPKRKQSSKRKSGSSNAGRGGRGGGRVDRGGRGTPPTPAISSPASSDGSSGSDSDSGSDVVDQLQRKIVELQEQLNKEREARRDERRRHKEAGRAAKAAGQQAMSDLEAAEPPAAKQRKRSRVAFVDTPASSGGAPEPRAPVDGETLAGAIRSLGLVGIGVPPAQPHEQPGKQVIDLSGDTHSLAYGPLPDRELAQHRDSLREQLRARGLAGPALEAALATAFAVTASEAMLGKSRAVANAADEALAPDAALREGRRPLALRSSPYKEVAGCPAISEILDSVQATGGSVDALCTALASVRPAAAANAERFSKEVSAAIKSSQARIKQAAAAGNYQAAYAIASEAHGLEREYRDQWIPLVELLGHKKATEFFRSRTDPLSGISEDQWQLAATLAGSKGFREIFAHALGVLTPSKKPKQQQPVHDKPAGGGSSSGQEGHTGPGLCTFCGRGKHLMMNCRAFAAAMAGRGGGNNTGASSGTPDGKRRKGKHGQRTN
jgi:hypothetical protein